MAEMQQAEAGDSAVPGKAQVEPATEQDHEDKFMTLVEAAQKELEMQKYAQKAFGCIDKNTNPVRKACITILDWVWFDRGIMLLILVNSLCMAAFANPIEFHMLSERDEKLDRDWGCGPGQNYSLVKDYEEEVEGTQAYIEYVFLALFTTELIIKVIGCGFIFERGSYLSNSWNWLDMIVVITGFVEVFSSGGGAVQVLRLFRLLRPLRALQRVRGMRVLVKCILEAVPQLCRVFMVLCLLVLVLGIVGVQLFHRRLRHACHIPDGEGGWESTDIICDPQCWDTWDEITQQQKAETRCDSLGALTKRERNDNNPWSWTCEGPDQQCLCGGSAADDPYCTWLDNPNYGVNSFDNILSAMMTIFQSITLEGWVDNMYMLQDGISPITPTLYAIVIVLLGALIVMNLFLAVLADNFAMADAPEDGEELEEEEDGEEALFNAAKELVHTNKFRALCHKIVMDKRFDNFIVVCILVNTLIMCMEFYPENPNTFCDDDTVVPVTVNFTDDYCEAIEAAGFTGKCCDLQRYTYKEPAFYYALFSLNLILTVVFLFETVVKLIGLGPFIFIKDSFNIFDAIVVFISIIEILLDLLSTYGVIDMAGVPAMSALRALRVFRILKMVRSVPALSKIINGLMQSLKSVVYLAMLLLLFVFIFALLGMEFFGGFTPFPDRNYNYTQDNFPCAWHQWKITADEGSRCNFDRLGHAFLSIFVVLSGENWNEIYFDQHRATWKTFGPVATLYFVALFVVGNLLLFNLFIAILISNMEDDDDDEDDPEQLQEKNRPEMISYTFGGYASQGHAATPEDTDATSTSPERRTTGLAAQSSTTTLADDKKPPTPAEKVEAMQNSRDKSCCIFTWSNPVRKFCANVVWHPAFDQVVLVLILVSSILLMVDQPFLSKNDPIRKTLEVFDIIFTTLFTMEMLLKIIVLGFIYSKDKDENGHSKAYLRQPWNVLDFFVVIISIFSLISKNVKALQSIPASSLRAVRALRALRPLRLIARMENMRIVVSTLLSTAPAVGVFAMIMFLFVLIFAILFMQMFGGKLSYCLDPLHGDPVSLSPRMYSGSNFSKDNYENCSPEHPCFRNDYEECMSLSKYNLTRYNSVQVLLTDSIFATKKVGDIEPGRTYDLMIGNLADIPGPDDDNPYYEGKDGYKLYVEFPQWVNPDFGHFDNIFAAVHLLLEVACLEGWPDVMFWVMDTDFRGEYINPYWLSSNQNPDPIYQEPWFTNEHKVNEEIGSIFFVIWIILGCFVLLNMVIGVVLDSFNKIKEENDGLTMMTESQGEWVKAQKTIIAMRPLKQPAAPKETWRLSVFHLVTSNGFDLLIMSIIVTNMFFMCITTWEPSATDIDIYTANQIMIAANYIFYVLYLIEMSLKWIGLGVPQYFKDSWNIFDFILVVISTVDIILALIGTDNIPFPPALFRVLRLFRVVRILRILKTAKNLRTIITTIRISIPGLYNISILLFIFMVIYSVICMNLFFAVNFTPGDFFNTNNPCAEEYKPRDPNWPMECRATSPVDNEETYWYTNGNSNAGDFVNRNANFRNIGISMLTLFRCATGESFNGIMHDLMAPDWGSNMLRCCPSCGPQIDKDEMPLHSCGPMEGMHGVWAVIIFWSYTLIMGFIILNGLFIGVIVDNFTNIGSENKAITVESIEEYREVWLRFDPKGTFAVPSHSLLVILQQLRSPLGISDRSPPPSRAEMLSLLGQLDIPDHGGQIHFMETLTALAHRACGVPVPVCDTTRRLQKSVAKTPALKNLEKPVHNALTNYLVSLLQSRWRGYAMRKKYADPPEAGGSLPPSSDLPPHQSRPDASAEQPKYKSNQVLPAP